MCQGSVQIMQISFVMYLGIWHLKIKDEVWHQRLKNVINYTLALKWEIKLRTGPLILCCLIGVKRLTGWAKGYRHMNFAILMVWRDPEYHSSDFYFCDTQIKGMSSKSKHTVKYPNLQFAVRPVPHSEDWAIPHPATHLTVEDESELNP
jgi:hypothetical protein